MSLPASGAVNNWQAFYDDLRSIVQAAWPEVGMNLRTIRSVRINWSNELQDHFDAPYVIIAITPQRQSQDFSPMDGVVYECSVTLHYIAMDDGDQGTNVKGLDFDDWLDDRMFTAQQQAIALDNNGTFKTMQIAEDFNLDATETNPINYELQQADMPLWACSVEFTALSGNLFNAPVS